MVKHEFWKLKRMLRLVRSYPEEALWEQVFRECLRNRVASVCAPRARLRKGKVVDD